MTGTHSHGYISNMKPRSCHILDTLTVTLAVTTVGSARLHTTLQMASAARRVDTTRQGKGLLVVGSTAENRVGQVEKEVLDNYDCALVFLS